MVEVFTLGSTHAVLGSGPWTWWSIHGGHQRQLLVHHLHLDRQEPKQEMCQRWACFGCRVFMMKETQGGAVMNMSPEMVGVFGILCAAHRSEQGLLTEKENVAIFHI